jgi:ABC-type lipoprotein release transport system permease subunit
MKAAFWLAWRELVNRRSALVAGIALVSVAVALCTATELVSSAREAAVAAQIDHMGPALHLIPAGKTARDLARFDLGSGSFGNDEVERIYRSLSSWIRALEGRLLLRLPLEGRAASLIGIDPSRVISPFKVLGRLGDSDAVIGAELARSLGKEVGNELLIRGSRFRVAAVLPETASVEDLAAFLPLKRLQNLFELDTVNEIRVFPAPGASIEEIVSHLKSAQSQLRVINVHRGEAAEHEMGHTLRQHRRVLYMITALVVALCVFIWSYLNAGERSLEMATVVAIGGTGVTVLSMLVIRAAVVGFLGALLGYFAGASIALAQDLESAVGVAFSWKLLLAMSGGTVLVSILGACPASILSAFRKHVAVLQEW